MKIRVILSILFVIATTFSVIHEIEHIMHADGYTCEVCIVDNHSVSADIISKTQYTEIFHFEKISQNNLVSTLHVRTNHNQSRAPPLTS
ncbi:hypothetical protein HUE87_00315 [Candidatus Sulfurimonas marisnigri]|uniref:Uncharacterized protein n=1 Tax=Candidatus Sulfurimonas marisnigri TaxID=2740405 RepID=A0A7S7M0E8_9BACT|nr:hypothetical protein [Candidatus Sulfurimonas marisnigri]QOY54729.1 hypothetical protein HUE87_00315 [Candidatus Sulfurimonas marisnigri]